MFIFRRAESVKMTYLHVRNYYLHADVASPVQPIKMEMEWKMHGNSYRQKCYENKCRLTKALKF